MKPRHQLAATICTIFVWSLIFISINAEVLANSGYPTAGANAERNYMINRPFVCPNVSGGKTTVLNPSWTWPPDLFYFTMVSKQITVDEFGYIYVQGTNGNGDQVIKIDINTGQHFPQSYLGGAYPDPAVTHVQGNKFYMSKMDNIAVVNSATMAALFEYSSAVTGNGPSSFIPWSSNYMIESNTYPSDYSIVSIQYYDTTNNVFQTNLPQYYVGQPVLAMVYKNTTIVLAGWNPNEGLGHIATSGWSVDMNESPQRAWIDGDELIIQSVELIFMKYHMSNGTQTFRKPYNQYQGNFYSGLPFLMYHQGISFTQIAVAEDRWYVDIINEVNITKPTGPPVLQAQPILSKVDNTLLYVQSTFNYDVEFIGVEWGSWETKLVGQLAEGIFVGDVYQMGTPIVHDNCNAAVIAGQRLYGLKPLPIQNVVPILECYNPDDGNAFFSYNNFENRSFIIPRVSDRNNISPLNVVPVKTFAVGRGPAYPLSLQVPLGFEAATYTWTLEDYVLTFTVGPSIYCPRNVTVVITLTADSPFPLGFEEVVRTTFVNVTGISGSRVTIITANNGDNGNKRSVTQTNTLETELQVGPDNTNTEPDASTVVQNFVSSQQTDFNNQVSTADGAPPNVQTIVGGKEPDIAVQGTIPPKAAPVATTPVVAESPTFVPVPVSTPTNQPIIQPTSVAARTSFGLLLLLSSFCVLA